MKSVIVIDAHAGGDVSRVIVGGVIPPAGDSLNQQMRNMGDLGPSLRRLLLSEPRGHAGMYADLIVPPTAPSAGAGFIIISSTGYPYMSGSNTICVATVLLETGMVEPPPPGGTLRLQTPMFEFDVTPEMMDGRVYRVTYDSPPSRCVTFDRLIQVPEYGNLRVDIVHAAHLLYPILDADKLGFSLTREEIPDLIRFGKVVVEAVEKTILRRDPIPSLTGVKTVDYLLFAGPLDRLGPERGMSRLAVFCRPGVICRSPSGTGLSARLAQLYGRRTIRSGFRLKAVSPFEMSFEGRATDDVTPDVGGPIINTRITGRAHLMGHCRLIRHDDDPFPLGPG